MNKRQIIAALMLSPLYFSMSLKQRGRIVRRFSGLLDPRMSMTAHLAG